MWGEWFDISFARLASVRTVAPALRRPSFNLLSTLSPASRGAARRILHRIGFSILKPPSCGKVTVSYDFYLF
jgi:hypothetical protein